MTQRSHFTSAGDRPVRLRVRPDLIRADNSYVIADPVQRTHHELSSEESALLDWLAETNGKTTLNDLRQQYNRQFAPRRINERVLAHRLSQLHKAGLLIADAPGQGDALWIAREETQRNESRLAWARLLAIRLRGFDPNRLLGLLDRPVGWVFTPVGGFGFVLLCVTAVLILLANADRFIAELPSVARLADPGQIFLALACLAVLKTLHELGHGLACKRVGRWANQPVEVREMGVMLLALVPCLYCDVSDTWRFPERRQRLLVTAAGVLVELAVAAIAVIVWQWAEPGIVRLLALNTVVIATLGTLLINFNPLMRFDGYYFLSDLTGTSNLWTRSRTAVCQRFQSVFLRNTEGTPQEPLWMALYGIASQIYLATVMLGIAWLAIVTARSWRFDAIGWMIAMLVAATIVLPQLGRWFSTVQRPTMTRQLRTGRATFAMLAMLVACVLLWRAPWPDRVAASVVVAPNNASRVTVTLPGRIVEIIAVGTAVSEGDVLARLDNAEIRRGLLQAETEVARLQGEINLLEAQRTFDPKISAKLPTTAAQLADAKHRLAELQNEAQRLWLRAPQDGVVMAPAAVHGDDQDNRLASWSGSPLEPANHGAWLEAGTVLCLVGPPDNAELELLIDESAADRVALGQPVRVRLEQNPGRILTGHVTAIGRQAELLTESLEDSIDTKGHRLQVRFEPSIANQTGRPLVLMGTGHARVDSGYAPIGEQLSAAFWRTFRLP